MQDTILINDNPILHQVAKPVTNFGTEELHQLIEHMFAVMRAKNGVGLAATQIGIAERIFVYGFEHSPRYPDVRGVPVLAVINPEILSESAETTDYEEGCLSIPYKRGLITRSKSITFHYQDVAGNWFEKVVHDFEARIVQHEIDHLNGILISDRAKTLHESKLV